MPRGLPNLPWTDGIRAAACLILVIWHAVLTAIPGDHTAAQAVFTLPIAVMARESVVVFIILSGLLLGRHWSGAATRTEFNAVSLIYVRRRLWRLVPPFWAALTIVIICMLVFGLRHESGTHWDTGLPLTWDRVLTNYAMVTDLVFQVPLSHQFWSVPTELHLYALGPLVALLVRRRALVILSGAALTAMVVILAPHYHAPYFVFIFVASFWLGLQRQQLTSTTVAKSLRLSWPIAAASLVLIVVALGADTLSTSTRNYFLADALVAPVFCVWLFHADLSGSRGVAVRVMSWRPLHWIGHRSYSIYLMHAVVIELLWRGLFDPAGASGRVVDVILLSAASILASILAGTALYEAVERPSARRSAAIRRPPAGMARPVEVDGKTA